LLLAKKRQTYVPLSRFPKVEQDICLQVSSDLSYQELYSFVAEKLREIKPEDTAFTLSPADIYQKDEAVKRITFRLSIYSYIRTLKAEEVNKLLDEVAAAANNKFDAERI
jgi:phenylalanyl-tRNA synthetase beta subunit